jgi:hypothetical protein
MSAEPAKARTDTPPAQTTVTVTFSASNGYGFTPASASVANDGTVQFIAPQACWVWTYANGAYTNVFNNESSNHVVCQVGGNNNFVVASAYANTVIETVGTNVNAAQPAPPVEITENVKGTIHVGSSGANTDNVKGPIHVGNS